MILPHLGCGPCPIGGGAYFIDCSHCFDCDVWPLFNMSVDPYVRLSVGWSLGPRFAIVLLEKCQTTNEVLNKLRFDGEVMKHFLTITLEPVMTYDHDFVRISWRTE